MTDIFVAFPLIHDNFSFDFLRGGQLLKLPKHIQKSNQMSVVSKGTNFVFFLYGFTDCKLYCSSICGGLVTWELGKQQTCLFHSVIRKTRYNL